MAECFICGRSGRGLGINRGDFNEHFCSIACQDAAYVVLKRGGVPQVAIHYPAALAQAIDEGGAFIAQVGSTNLAEYTETQAQGLVDCILHGWQRGCYMAFCKTEGITVPFEYEPKPMNDTDKQYAKQARAEVGVLLRTMPTMDMAQWTMEQVQQFAFCIVNAVRKEAENEAPF